MALRVRNLAGREFTNIEINSTQVILLAIGLFFTGSLLTLAVFFASMACRVSEYFEYLGHRQERRRVVKKLAKQDAEDSARIEASVATERKATSVC